MSVALQQAAAPGRAGGETATVADLVEDRIVEGVFAVSRKRRLTTKAGRTYLAVELVDKTGGVEGRIWSDVELLDRRFREGDAVRVLARVERFRDRLQLDVRSLEPTEVDPATLAPQARRDLDELDGFFEHLAREVHDPHLRRLLDSFVLDDAFRAKLRRAPCTRAGHHAYLGGLIEHTVAVATLALESCVLHQRLDSDLLMTAALLHDLGKTREFTLGADIALSEEGAMLGHLNLGQQLVAERASRITGFPRERLLALSHCILAHHGPEGLPGRRFRSVEALALHRLNALDAGVKGALEHGLGP